MGRVMREPEIEAAPTANRVAARAPRKMFVATCC